MKTYNIIILPGDGIGPEVVNEALKVLDACAVKFNFELNYNEQLIGAIAIEWIWAGIEPRVE